MGVVIDQIKIEWHKHICGLCILWWELEQLRNSPFFQLQAVLV